MMKGKGAPRSTVFGVLGRTMEEPEAKSLGGLVRHTADAKIQPGTVKHDAARLNTERHIAGKAAKTTTSGAHYGQILYPGAFMGHRGDEL
jgi:hypothetical protein